MHRATSFFQDNLHEKNEKQKRLAKTKQNKNSQQLNMVDVINDTKLKYEEYMADTCAASSHVRFGFSEISLGGSLQIQKVKYHPV